MNRRARRLRSELKLRRRLGFQVSQDEELERFGILLGVTAVVEIGLLIFVASQSGMFPAR